MRILVVEDERKVARALKQGLEAESYSVALAHTGEDGFFLANSQPFDLVVLDVMLPGRNGIEVLSAMRKRGVRIPVLLLTAKDAIEDRVLGLDAGADDYLVKPFAFPEDLHVDRINRTVMRGNRALDLTAKEFELVEYLLENHGQVVSRETLAREIWKAVARHTTLDNVIDVHMARIRRKVDEGYTTKFVHTVRGVGFLLKAEKS